MDNKANRSNTSDNQRTFGKQSSPGQNFQQSSAGGINDFVEFSYKDSDEFLEKSKEFAEKLAGDEGKDLSKSQLRKFYDQVISLRDEALSSKKIEVENIIFKLKLLQARVIYLANRKKDKKNTYISSTAKRYLGGILERGITLCKESKEDIKKTKDALKKFSNEFEAIYAFFYMFSKDKD